MSIMGWFNKKMRELGICELEFGSQEGSFARRTGERGAKQKKCMLSVV